MPIFTCKHLAPSLILSTALIFAPLAFAENDNLLDSQSIDTLTAQAEQGNAEAQAKLSTHYGKTGNYAAALSWAQQAAAQGNSEAQYNLGRLYFYGWGVAQDYSKARQWFKKAAAQGLPEAKQALQQLQQMGY